MARQNSDTDDMLSCAEFLKETIFDASERSFFESAVWFCVVCDVCSLDTTKITLK